MTVMSDRESNVAFCLNGCLPALCSPYPAYRGRKTQPSAQILRSGRRPSPKKQLRFWCK